MPDERWPQDEESLAYIREKWEEPFGDMRQELVFIGQRLNEHGIRAQLDACLLSDAELLAGQSVWNTLPDPFPSWSE